MRHRLLLLVLFIVGTSLSCDVPCGGQTFPKPFCDFACSDDMLTLGHLQAKLADIDRSSNRVLFSGDLPCVDGRMQGVSGKYFSLVEKENFHPNKGCCIFVEGLCSTSCSCNATCFKQACEGYNITLANGTRKQSISISGYFTWKNESHNAVTLATTTSRSSSNSTNVTSPPSMCSQQCNSTRSCPKHKCPQHCPCRKSTKKNIFIIGGIAVAGGVLLVLLVFFLAMRRKRMLQSSRYSSCRAHILADNGAPSPTCFTLKALKAATKSFSESRLLGGGGFSTVYQGKLPDGRIVAVKKLNQGNKQAIQQFQNEVIILSKVKHANLVQLLGYCLEGRDLLVVYEYLPNGTLADHLHGDDTGEVLTLEKRLNIALETAKALAYLHFYVTPPIYHRDVKSSNILLDKNFTVKVADFGLSRLTNIDATNISTAPQGTPGYLDPDYHESYQLTDKSDVYSFGVVLLELVSRKKVVDMTRDRKEINLASMALAKIHSGALHELFDPELSVKYWKILSRVVEVAFRCIATEKDDRPNMLEVVASLEQITGLLLAGGNSIKSEDGSKTPTLELIASKKQQRSLVACLDQDSPTSVQMKWPSTHTSPNNSKTEI